MQMKLKLLGILQDYGSPYALLYINDVTKGMYLAIEQQSDELNRFRFLLLKVTSDMVTDYMRNAIGLRKISEMSEEKYLWNKTKGSKGTMICLGRVDVTKYIDEEDDMFDAEFCRNEASIHYYVNQN